MGAVAFVSSCYRDPGVSWEGDGVVWKRSFRFPNRVFSRCFVFITHPPDSSTPGTAPFTLFGAAVHSARPSSTSALLLSPAGNRISSGPVSPHPLFMASSHRFQCWPETCLAPLSSELCAGEHPVCGLQSLVPLRWCSPISGDIRPRCPSDGPSQEQEGAALCRGVLSGVVTLPESRLPGSVAEGPSFVDPRVFSARCRRLFCRVMWTRQNATQTPTRSACEDWLRSVCQT